MAPHGPPPPDGDDTFDDAFEASPYAPAPSAAPGAAPPAPGTAPGAAPYSAYDDDGDFGEEAVLGDGEAQNVPNAYNVRNILALAAVGFLLVLGTLLFSVRDSEEDRRLGAVDDTAGEIPAGALPPDLLGRAEMRPGEPLPEDDLSVLLNDPQVAQGGYGGYSQPAAEPAYASPPPAAPSGGAAAPRERAPTYRDERREAFFAALGLPSRRVVGALPAGGSAPAGYDPASGQAGYAQTAYGPAGAAGYPEAPTYSGGASGGPLPEGAALVAASQRSQVAQPGGQARTLAGSTRAAAAFRRATVSAEPAFDNFAVAQGTFIPLVVETAVNSDLEGVLLARTVEDVYDRSRRHVLIPRGSQMVFNYRRPAPGDTRLKGAAVRLNFPDGRSVDFSNADLHDLQGRLGLEDQIIRHTLSRITAGAALAVAGVAAGVAGRRSNRTVVTIQNPDGSITQVPIDDEIRDEAIANGARGAQSAFEESSRRTFERPNTLLIRAGIRGLAVLRQDVDLGQPYYSDGYMAPVGRSPFDSRARTGLRGRAVVAPAAPAPPPPSLLRETGTRRP